MRKTMLDWSKHCCTMMDKRYHAAFFLLLDSCFQPCSITYFKNTFTLHWFHSKATIETINPRIKCPKQSFLPVSLLTLSARVRLCACISLYMNILIVNRSLQTQNKGIYYIIVAGGGPSWYVRSIFIDYYCCKSEFSWSTPVTTIHAKSDLAVKLSIMKPISPWAYSVNKHQKQRRKQVRKESPSL